MRESVELYTKVQPPGDPIPINIDPFAINDEIPTDAEVREVVRGLRNGRAGGVSGIRAEHMKQWLQDVMTEEEKGTVGLRDKWRVFLDLVQTIWEEGEVPQQMLWMTVVLLPKGGGDYRGIRLLEPF